MAEFDVLRDLLVIFLVSVAVAAPLRRVGVPAIAGFIVAGALVGPLGLGLIGDRHEVEILAEIGVALLLFGIGLELQIGRLRRLWRPVLVGGAVQVGSTALIAAAIGLSLGMAPPGAAFLGLVVAVSSTAIVLRGLDARGEIDAPHGRLTLGILIFQDLSVVPMILAIPLLAGAMRDSGPASIGLVAVTMGRAVLLLAAVVFGSWILVPRLLHWIARTRQRELFVLTVFLVCIGTAWLASWAGVSLALGAFLAGLVVAGSEYRHQAMADLIPFREILTSLFFVSVGMLLDPRTLLDHPFPVIGIVVAILVGKFLIVFLVASVMRLPLRVAVLGAAALAQVGEFSFVLMHAASGTNLLDPGFSKLLMPAIIISMLVTPLAIALGPSLAAGASRIRPLTRLLGVRTPEDALFASETVSGHVIIAGYGLTGRALAGALRDCGVSYVIVDLNPDNVRRAAREGEPAYFGDVTSPEVLKFLGAPRAREIVLVVNDPRAAERAVKAVREVAPAANVIVRARYAGDVEALMEAGATEVVPAEIEAAAAVASRVLTRCAADESRVREQVERIRTALRGT